MQRSENDTIKHNTWPETPYGKVTKTQEKQQVREPKGQPVSSRWSQYCKEQTRHEA